MANAPRPAAPRPRAHWPELTRPHARHYRQRLDPALLEPGLAPYMLRVFVLGLAWPRCRSRSLMRPEDVAQD